MGPLGSVVSICGTPAQRQLNGWMDGRWLLGYVISFAEWQVSKAKKVNELVGVSRNRCSSIWEHILLYKIILYVSVIRFALSLVTILNTCISCPNLWMKFMTSYSYSGSHEKYPLSVLIPQCTIISAINAIKLSVLSRCFLRIEKYLVLHTGDIDITEINALLFSM